MPRRLPALSGSNENQDGGVTEVAGVLKNHGLFAGRKPSAPRVAAEKTGPEAEAVRAAAGLLYQTLKEINNPDGAGLATGMAQRRAGGFSILLGGHPCPLNQNTHAR